MSDRDTLSAEQAAYDAAKVGDPAAPPTRGPQCRHRWPQSPGADWDWVCTRPVGNDGQHDGQHVAESPEKVRAVKPQEEGKQAEQDSTVWDWNEAGLKRHIRRLRAERDAARAERDEARAALVLEMLGRQSTVEGWEYEYRLTTEAGTPVGDSGRHSREAAWASARDRQLPPRTVQRRAVGPWFGDPEPLS